MRLDEPVPTPEPPLLELLEVMRRLRRDCAWKRAQTHRSLARYLVEETHETLEALETGTPEELCEELGDLLLQVYFHAVVAEESGDFTLDDVAAGIVAKLRRRNPHVFGTEGGGAGDAGDAPTDPAAVNELWEQAKAAEKPRGSVTDGIPPGLPALLYADKVLDRLERAGVATPASDGAAHRGPLFLLVPSPLLGPATWEPVARRLRAAGRDAEVVDLGLGPRTPDDVVGVVVAAAGERPVVLVPHSNAGLYVPHLVTVLDVRGTVYVDAALPDEGTSTPLAPDHLLGHLRSLADSEGLLPPWTQWWDETGGIGHLFPDAQSRERVEREQPRLGLDYFEHRLPVHDGWADAPAAYLGFGDTYAAEQELAARLGWPRTVLDGGRLHALWEPDAVADAIRALADELLPPLAPDHRLLGERLLGLTADSRAVGANPEQALRDAVRLLLGPTV